MRAEVVDVLGELAGARLPAADWPEVHGHLERLGRAVAAGDEALARTALAPLRQATFEAKVRHRLSSSAGRGAPVVVPTKRTSALPVVGAACGALLLASGYLIGGGLVLVATAVLAVFVLGVALAGTQANRDRQAARGAARDAAAGAAPDAGGGPVDAPAPIAALATELRTAMLRSGDDPGGT
ncbi:MAG: CATRA system-associated protein [Acidimicrobiia bacterium]